MSEFRPRLLSLCVVALVALLGAFGVGAAQTWIDLPPSATGVVQVAEKSELESDGYVWSATRIESGIRLRGYGADR